MYAMAFPLPSTCALPPCPPRDNATFPVRCLSAPSPFTAKQLTTMRHENANLSQPTVSGLPLPPVKRKKCKNKANFVTRLSHPKYSSPNGLRSFHSAEARKKQSQFAMTTHHPPLTTEPLAPIPQPL